MYKTEKKDLVRAEKAAGQSNLRFTKKEQSYWWRKLVIFFCTQIITKAIFFNSSQTEATTTNTPKSGLCLMRIFRILTESYPYFPVYGQNLPYTGKYGPEEARIST